MAVVRTTILLIKPDWWISRIRLTRRLQRFAFDSATCQR